MKIAQNNILLMLLIVIAGFAPLGAQSKDNNVKGNLIYYSDNAFKNLNITNRSEWIIRLDIMPSSGGTIKLSKINENSFLYDTDFDNKIYIYNLESDESKQVNTGYFPVMAPGSTKYIFMRSTSATGPQIYLADLNDQVNSARQMTAELGKPLHDAYPVMISANSALFSVASNGQYNLYMMSLDKDSIVQVPSAQPCIPQLWRSRTSHVLCLDPIERKYYFMGLNGKFVGHADINYRTEQPILYSPEYDAILLTKYRSFWRTIGRGEIADLWFLDLSDRKKYLVRKQTYLLPGSAMLRNP